MDDEVRERVERAAEVDALFNALKHDSDAQVGAIMGPLMGENPEFREYGDEVAGVVAPVVERVNGMDREERRERLAELAPERLEELEREDEDEDDQPLPDLPNVDDYEEVRMRLAPNPNGPWHLGSARMPAVIGTYKALYDGWMLCRFDDTDPETKRPDLDAYDAILDAIDYLGFEPDEVMRASDRLEVYYDHARELIDLGGAYTCSCPAEEFSELKNAGEACPHRDADPEAVREEFEAMVDGAYSSGEMVLRVKTDIHHKNPALRDFVAFRMIDTPHPREEASEYRCWPMLDFQSGVDDHLTGITHIIRGIDLQDSAKKQRFVYDYFGWDYPEVVHWGHVQVDAYDVAMSTSTIKGKVERGELTGWDDPRAPTLASLRRRGIRGEAIVDAMVELGTSTSNVDLAMSSIYANNRELIDDETDRAFLVRAEGPDGNGNADGDRDADGNGNADGDGDGDGDGGAGETDGTGETAVAGAVEMSVEGGPAAGEPPVHPDHEERGRRRIPVESAVYVEADDVPPVGDRVWLKGFGCVRHEDDQFVFTDDDIGVVRSGDVDVVHWVPVAGAVPTRLRTMDGDVTGYAEPGVTDYDADEMVQFERVGFARTDSPPGRDPDSVDSDSTSADSVDSDSADTEKLVAYFAHP